MAHYCCNWSLITISNQLFWSNGIIASCLPSIGGRFRLDKRLIDEHIKPKLLISGNTHFTVIVVAYLAMLWIGKKKHSREYSATTMGQPQLHPDSQRCPVRWFDHLPLHFSVTLKKSVIRFINVVITPPAFFLSQKEVSLVTEGYPPCAAPVFSGVSCYPLW